MTKIERVLKMYYQKGYTFQQIADKPEIGLTLMQVCDIIARDAEPTAPMTPEQADALDATGEFETIP